MTVLSEVRAVAEVTGTPWQRAECLASIQSETPALDPRLAYADTEVGTELRDAARPRGGWQVVAFRVYVDGAEVPIGRRLPGLEVTRRLGAGATWSLPVPRRADYPQPFPSPVGTIQAYKGPPPGLKPIVVDGVYLTPSGLQTVRLITDGIVHGAEQDGERIQLSGLDAWGRHDEKQVTLTLPPGHGLDRRDVARRLGAQGGATLYALTRAGRMDKELQAVDQPWIPLAQALMQPAGKLLQWDPDGRLVNPRAAVVGGRYDHVIREADLVARSWRKSSTNNGPTRVIVTGTRQVTRDECGRRLEVRVSQSYGIYLPRRAQWLQSGTTGDLTAVSQPTGEAATLIRVGLSYEEREVECETVIRERRVEMGWYNPQRARYQLAVDGTIGGYYGTAPPLYLLDAGAAKDDDAPGYVWPRERFVVIRDEETWHRFDDRDFLTETETVVRGWGHQRERVKVAESPAVAWELTDYVANQPILANGEGVAELEERLYGTYRYLAVQRTNDTQEWVLSRAFATSGNPRERRVTRFDVSDDGYILSERTETRGWTTRPGSGDFWHERIGESADEVETFRAIGAESVTYAAAQGEGSHSVLRRAYDADGRLVEGSTEDGLPGYLPAATRRADTIPDPAIYEEGEAAEPMSASRQESQPIKGEARSTALESVRPARTERLSSEWAESPAECETIARTTLRVETAPTVSFELPLNFTIFEGQRVLVIPSRDEAVPVHVTEVTHREGSPADRQPSLTAVTGRWYVV